MLLVAGGIDANDQVIPLAWALSRMRYGGPGLYTT